MAEAKKTKLKQAVKIAGKQVKLKNKPIKFLDKISLRGRLDLHNDRESKLSDGPA